MSVCVYPNLRAPVRQSHTYTPQTHACSMRASRTHHECCCERVNPAHNRDFCRIVCFLGPVVVFSWRRFHCDGEWRTLTFSQLRFVSRGVSSRAQMFTKLHCRRSESTYANVFKQTGASMKRDVIACISAFEYCSLGTTSVWSVNWSVLMKQNRKKIKSTALKTPVHFSESF